MHEQEFLIAWFESRLEVDEIIEEVLNGSSDKRGRREEEEATDITGSLTDSGDIPAPITTN